MTLNLRQYKRLLCSPMGCVRDLIPIKKIASNIVKFQFTTGVPVTIIVQEEKLARSQQNKLCYDEFIKKLQEEINDCRKTMTHSELQVDQMSSNSSRTPATHPHHRKKKPRPATTTRDQRSQLQLMVK